MKDWFHILSDPDRPQLERMLRVGERVAWPALRMVRNRMTVEVSVSSCLFEYGKQGLMFD